MKIDFFRLYIVDWRYRLHAIASLEDALKSSEKLARVQPNLDSLLRTLLSSEKNPDVAEDKRKVIMNLISRLPLDNLENRTGQIITGLCRQGGPGSNRVSKALMQRLPPAVIVLKLLSEEFLHARSSRFRENALQMVMFALMTFPSTCFDTFTCVTRAAYAALDRKKRVRQAALDVLAILGQVTSPRTVMEIVQNITSDSGYKSSDEFCAAVKARLSRKQLPNISPEGYVQYALRVPSPQSNHPADGVGHLGADIEWIASGIGSVSPTSMKRRSRYQQQCCDQNHQPANSNSSSNSSNGSIIFIDPNRQLGRRIKPPHEIPHYGLTFQNAEETAPNRIIQYHHLQNDGGGGGGGAGSGNISSNGEIIGINGRRIATHTKKPTCLDSSPDGRKSDSIRFQNGAGAVGGEGRSTRHSITSRFPAMERLDVTGTSTSDRQQLYRNPYEIVLPNGNRLNVNYPRPSYSIYRKGARNINYPSAEAFGDVNYENHHHQQQQQQQAAYQMHYGGNSNDPNDKTNHTAQNPKRFMNVDKFMMQSNKYNQEHIYSTTDNLHNFNSQQQHHQNNFSTRTPQQQQHQNDGFEDQQRRSKTPGSERERRFIPPTSSASVSVQTSASNSIRNNPVGVFDSSSVHSFANKHNDDDDDGDGGGPSAGVGDDRESSEISSSEPDEHVSGSDHLIPTHVITNDSPITPKKHSTEVERISRPPSNVHDEQIAESELRVGSTDDVQTPEHNAVSTRPVSSFSEKSYQIQEEIETNPEFLGAEIETEEAQPVPDNKTDEPEKISMNDAEPNEESKDELDQISIETCIVTEQKEEELTTIVKSHMEENHSASEPLPHTKSSTPSPLPTLEVKPISRQSSTLALSSESIYEPPIKRDIEIQSTASTGSSSDCPPSVAASDPDPINFNSSVKPHHVPLLRKSKTTLFGSRSRRISPVKQAVKSNKTELFPQTLTRFDKPKDGLNQAYQQLESSNWEITMTGLVSMVRLMRFHPEHLDANIHLVCLQLAKTVKNLRSQVARAACQASTEFFSVRNKFLEQECDDLVGNLLTRTADTNRFLRADATRALESMCDNLSPPKVLHLLTVRGAQHPNAVVRTSTAKLMNRLVDRLGCEKVFSMNRENREKVFVTGANLLLEGSLETRNYAKTLFRTLCDHPNYNRSIMEYIPARTFRNIEKTLKAIK